MAVKKGKTRIIFTLPISQAEWLKEQSIVLNLSVSELIRFFIRTSNSRFMKLLPQRDLDLIIQIAKTEWLNDDED